MIRIALILPLFALLLDGCTRPVESPAPVKKTAPAKAPAPPAAPVRTDRSSYVLTNGPQGPEATIVTTLRAPADKSLYLLNCNRATGVNLQRRVGDQWVYAWTVMMNACLSPPIVVPPNGEHTARVYLHEHSGGVTYPERARMIESGTYRVIWTGVLTSYDANGRGPELPLEQRVSAPITIEVPPLTELIGPGGVRRTRRAEERPAMASSRPRSSGAGSPRGDRPRIRRRSDRNPRSLVNPCSRSAVA